MTILELMMMVMISGHCQSYHTACSVTIQQTLNDLQWFVLAVAIVGVVLVASIALCMGGDAPTTTVHGHTIHFQNGVGNVEDIQIFIVPIQRGSMIRFVFPF